VGFTTTLKDCVLLWVYYYCVIDLRYYYFRDSAGVLSVVCVYWVVVGGVCF